MGTYLQDPLADLEKKPFSDGATQPPAGVENRGSQRAARLIDPKSPEASMLKQEPVYVALDIETNFSDLWEYTHNPRKQQEWDLRFSEITLVPAGDHGKEYHYRTHIGFGLHVSGIGAPSGPQYEETGESTSALNFWSEQPLSLIKRGSGYWKYSMTGKGFRFQTWFDYQTRFGGAGRWFDMLIFRPLLGWATAWSFDCLRLWLEKQIHPRLSLRLSMLHLFLKLLLAFVWVSQGFATVLASGGGLFTPLRTGGMIGGLSGTAFSLVGWTGIVFGCLFLLLHHKLLHYLNITLLLSIALGSLLLAPGYYSASLNTPTLIFTLIGLSAAELTIFDNLPTARRCSRKAPVKISAVGETV